MGMHNNIQTLAYSNLTPFETFEERLEITIHGSLKNWREKKKMFDSLVCIRQQSMCCFFCRDLLLYFVNTLSLSDLLSKDFTNLWLYSSGFSFLDILKSL